MRKKGKSRGPSKEDIDRQAAEEVARLTRSAGRPPGAGFGPSGPSAQSGPLSGFNPYGGPVSPLDAIAASVQGQTRPSSPGKGGAPRVRPPSPYDDPAAFVPPSPLTGPGPGPGQPYAGGEEDYDDDIGITELALVDHASRFGTNPEDLVIVQSDPVTAEEMRDRAMQQFFERQAAMKQSRPGARAPVTPIRGRTSSPAAPSGKLSPLQAAIERKRRQQAGEGDHSDADEQTPTQPISAIGFEPAPKRVFHERDTPDAEPLSDLEQLAKLRAGGARATPRSGAAKAGKKATKAPKRAAKAPSAKTVKTTLKKGARRASAATVKAARPAAKAGKATTKPAKAGKATRATKVAKASTGRAARKAPTKAPSTKKKR